MQLRERERVRESVTVHMGAKGGVCSMSIQMLSHSRASIQLKSQPSFTLRYRTQQWQTVTFKAPKKAATSN